MRRSHHAAPLRRKSPPLSRSLSAQAAAVKKDIRNSAPTPVGPAGRKWLQACWELFATHGKARCSALYAPAGY